MLPTLGCGVGCAIYLGDVHRRLDRYLLGEARREDEFANADFAASPEKKPRQTVPLGSRSTP